MILKSSWELSHCLYRELIESQFIILNDFSQLFTSLVSGTCPNDAQHSWAMNNQQFVVLISLFSSPPFVTPMRKGFHSRPDRFLLRFSNRLESLATLRAPSSSRKISQIDSELSFYNSVDEKWSENWSTLEIDKPNGSSAREIIEICQILDIKPFKSSSWKRFGCSLQSACLKDDFDYFREFLKLSRFRSI